MVAPRRPRARKPQKVIPRLIHAMVRRLVRQFDPEQIILFGSHARGTAGPDSDVDFMVVMPITGSKREKRIEMQLALDDYLVTKDIVVVTPEQMQRNRNIPGTIERPAALEGRILIQPELTLAEARRAVALARRVRRQARGWLPKQALTA